MISAENGSWDGGLTTQESVKYGRPITQEKKAVQSEKRSPVKTAESKKHFRHVVCSKKSEMQDETTMACDGDLKCMNVNDALHVHLMSVL